jgi:hypothetical protein
VSVGSPLRLRPCQLSTPCNHIDGNNTPDVKDSLFFVCLTVCVGVGDLGVGCQHQQAHEVMCEREYCTTVT